jgi:hypothetical protein
VWECPNCRERVDDSFEVCWKCGTSKQGVPDPSFRPADQVDPASLIRPEDLPRGQGPPAARAPPTAVTPEFARSPCEFTPEQNQVIASLAFNMRIVGVVSLIAGGLLAAAGCALAVKGGWPPLIQGVLALVIGGLTVQAAGAFRRIVDSRGDDIGHLMEALGALRTLYQVQVFLLFLALGLLALVLLAVVALSR